MTSERSGHSLIELLIALAMMALVLAAVLGTTIRSWRTHRTLGGRAEGRAQLEAGLLALALDLRSLSPVRGDLAAGEARDTSIEIRALVATGAICDTGAAAVAVRPATAPDFISTPPLPTPGDELWIWIDDDSAGSWRNAPVGSARRTASVGGTCARDGSAMQLTLSTAEWPRQVGAPVRVTRRTRWSSYRTADGWFLGRKEWNPSLGRFDVVQPVAGPLAPSGLSLRYFDLDGVEIPPGSVRTTSVARVDVTMRTPATDRGRGDSARVVVAFREHRR